MTENTHLHTRAISPALRLLFSFASNRRRPHYCEKEGCNNTTREGKPYCSDHVLDHVYAGTVHRLVMQRQQEAWLLEWRGVMCGIREDWLLVQETLAYLKHNGPKTVEGLARQLGIHAENHMRPLAEWLINNGIVKKSSTKRGSTVLRLANHEA